MQVRDKGYTAGFVPEKYSQIFTKMFTILY